MSQMFETPSKSVTTRDEEGRDDAFLQRSRAFFATRRDKTWAAHVAAEREAIQERTERLRKARLARALGLKELRPPE
jgi:hypothetical protein